MDGNEIAVVAQETNISIAREPEIVLSEARRAAQALGQVIAKKNRPVVFNGEQYLEYEDWQTVGQFYGYTPRTMEAHAVEVDGVKGAKAIAHLLDRNGQIVGGAEAYCMRDEKNWAGKPWFQLASMAQTRAGAKALRNRLSWVVVLAGYKPTPAEEMDVHTVETQVQPSDGKTIQQYVDDIKGWVGIMCNDDPAKVDAMVREFTKWKAKDTGQEKSLGVGDLSHIKKIDWVKRIHANVLARYNLFAAK